MTPSRLTAQEARTLSLTAGEYRRLGLIARRWAMSCADAGEFTEAAHQIKEAARFFWLADQIDNERKIA